MVDNDSIFLSHPIRQDGVNRCCKCDIDIQRPHKGEITGKFGEQNMTKIEYWCTRCGYPLTFHDLDLFEARLRGEFVD